MIPFSTKWIDEVTERGDGYLHIRATEPIYENNELKGKMVWDIPKCQFTEDGIVAYASETKDEEIS